jgi:hypothetical protein
MQIDIKRLKKRIGRKIATAGIDSSRCDLRERALGAKRFQLRPSL